MPQAQNGHIPVNYKHYGVIEDGKAKSGIRTRDPAHVRPGSAKTL